MFGKCAPANRLGNAGATLGRFAQGLVYRQSMPCGRTLSDESSCFSGKTKRLLAGIGTFLMCQQDFFAVFERIGANQVGKWTAFLRITLPSPFTEANRSSKSGCSSKANRFELLPDIPGLKVLWSSLTVFAIAVMVFTFSADLVMAKGSKCSDGYHWGRGTGGKYTCLNSAIYGQVDDLRDLDQADNERDVAVSTGEGPTSAA